MEVDKPLRGGRRCGDMLQRKRGRPRVSGKACPGFGQHPKEKAIQRRRGEIVVF